MREKFVPKIEYELPCPKEQGIPSGKFFRRRDILAAEINLYF